MIAIIPQVASPVGTVTNMLWLLVCAGLVFLMQPGFMCLESGLTRSKNSINVAVKNLADFGISLLLFWGLGLWSDVWANVGRLGWLGRILPGR
jgi:Amt family ammonium transporter